jgi:TonB family protein
MARFTCFAAIMMAATANLATAQTPTERVKELYSNAAYEDVLRAISPDERPVAAEIGQYAVFSLIALGRVADAEKAAEQMISADPRFRPDGDVSPRVLELFAAVRRRIGPGLLKAMYVKGKAALDRKDHDAAIAAFRDVLSVADDPDLTNDATVGEIRLLAAGFLELSQALPVAPAPSASVVPEAGPPASVAKAPTGPKITLPLPIREVLPPWTPSASLAKAEFRGTILVQIDAAGKVSSARIVDSVFPLYDAQLLQASRSWTYQPATINGVAAPSERAVEVVLRPRQ